MEWAGVHLERAVDSCLLVEQKDLRMEADIVQEATDTELVETEVVGLGWVAWQLLKSSHLHRVAKKVGDLPMGDLQVGNPGTVDQRWVMMGSAAAVAFVVAFVVA